MSNNIFCIGNLQLSVEKMQFPACPKPSSKDKEASFVGQGRLQALLALQQY